MTVVTVFLCCWRPDGLCALRDRLKEAFASAKSWIPSFLQHFLYRAVCTPSIIILQLKASAVLKEVLVIKHNQPALANVHVAKGYEVILREVSAWLGAALEPRK